MPSRLNLGGGQDYRYGKGWVNLDITKPANVIADMDVGLPFTDASFDYVLTSHVLEHRQDLRKLQMELARIVKRGGELEIVVPHYLSPDAWGDPTHCRGFSEESFQPCFWPGFTIQMVEGKRYTKTWTKSQVMWINVKMKRNEVEMSEIHQRIGGRNFQK